MFYIVVLAIKMGYVKTGFEHVHVVKLVCLKLIALSLCANFKVS